MNTFVAIVGHGPNDLRIPLVICSTREEAQVIVDKLPKHPKYENCLSDEFSEGQIHDEEIDEDEPAKIYGLLFKDCNYYAGCGGCYKVTIEEFSYGEPMVGWDLD